MGRFPFLGDTLAVGFPFLGDTLAWASLRGGKALGVTKPAFPPRAPPFRARRCSALWYAVVYWQMPVCCRIGGVRLSRFFFRRTEGGLRSRPVPGGCCIAGANLLLPVVLLLALISAPACCIAGADLLLPVAVLTALTCPRLLSHHWHKPTSACRCIAGAHLPPSSVYCRITGINPLPLTTGNRPAARAAFPSTETKIGSA